jgi:O-antigen/teichoic acid export membrane protein
MLVGFVWVVPTALATVLYAVSAANPAVLAQKLRFTLQMSFAIGLTMSGGLFVLAVPVLGLFGQSYAEQSAWSLRILALSILPLIFRAHYVAICRVHGRIARAAWLMAGSAALQVIAAAIGASLGGLTGVSIGWLAAMGLETIVTLPQVLRAVWPTKGRAAEGETSHAALASSARDEHTVSTQ